MTPKPLAELDLASLYKQKSNYTGILIGMGTLWFLILALGLYVALMKKTNFSLFAISMAFLPIGLPVFSALNKVNTEIKSRKSNL